MILLPNHWTPVGSVVRQISQTKTLRFIAKYLKWKELMKALKSESRKYNIQNQKGRVHGVSAKI